MKGINYTMSLKIENLKLLISVVFSAIIVLLKNCYYNNIPIFLIYILYFFSFFWLKKTESKLLFYIFIVPFSSGNLLYFINVVFYGLLFLECIKNRDDKNNSSKKSLFFISCIGLIFFEFVHFFTSSFFGYSDNIIKLLGFSLCTIGLTIIVKIKIDFILYRKIIYSWTLGIFVLFIGMLIVQNRAISFLYNNVRLGLEYGTNAFKNSIIIQNSNTIGAFCLIGMTGSLLLIRSEKKLSYVCFILNLIIGLFTGSRAFILFSFLVILSYIILFNSNKISIKKLIIFLLSAMCLILLNNKYHLFSYFAELFENRFIEEDFSGGRIDIYLKYFSFFASNLSLLIYGVGLQSYFSKISFITNDVFYMAHNPLIEIIASWGIIGLLNSLLFFYSMYKDYVFISKISIYNKAKCLFPFFAFILSTSSIMFFCGYYYMYAIIILTIYSSKYIVNACFLNDET